MITSPELLRREKDAKFDSSDRFVQELGLRMGRSQEIDIEDRDLRVEAVADRLVVPVEGRPARLTNWSLTQLCKQADPPGQPGYFARLPGRCAPHVADILNATLPERIYKNGTRLLVEHQNGDSTLRAVNSQLYERVWDVELAQVIAAGREFGFAPQGLYSGDRTSHVRMIARDKAVDLTGDGKVIYPAVEGRNSEVGASEIVWGIMWEELVCTNGMYVTHKAYRHGKRHVGSSVHQVIEDMHKLLPQLLEEAVSRDVAIFRAALTQEFAPNADEAQEGLRRRGFSRKLAEMAVKVAQEEFSDLSIYSLVFALTREAQNADFAQERSEAEFRASKLFELVEV